MADFAYTQNTGNLSKFIKEIPNRGVPPKVSTRYLESIGYKSNHDRSILTVLKFIGVLNSDGSPTEHYAKLRDTHAAPGLLASLILTAYADLFATYPDAYAKGDDVLRNYFASKTDVGDTSLKNIVKTFQAVCSCANFGAPGSVTAAPATAIPVVSPLRPTVPQPRGATTEVHFDIQVHIPGDQKPEVYESIFKNLGRYVLGLKDE